MPTIEDLRAALRDRADCVDGGALAGVAVSRRAQAAPRRRVAGPLLAAAAVVAAVCTAGAVGAVLSQDGTPAATGGAAATPPVWQFRIDDVPGWTVSSESLMWTAGHDGMPGAWAQGATLTPARGLGTLFYGYAPSVEAAFPGNGMSVAIRTGRAIAVSVAGQPGWWSPGQPVDTASMASGASNDPWVAVRSSGDWQPYLVWRNADGSWNSLMGAVGFRPKSRTFDNAVAWRAMSRIAKAVAPTVKGGPVTLPFAVRLGAGYQPSEIMSSSGMACAYWSAPRAASQVTLCRVTSDQQHSRRLGVVGGDAAAAGETVVRRDLGDGTVLVLGLDASVPADLVPSQVLDSVDVTPKLGDPATWLALGS